LNTVIPSFVTLNLQLFALLFSWVFNLPKAYGPFLPTFDFVLSPVMQH